MEINISTINFGASSEGGGSSSAVTYDLSTMSQDELAALYIKFKSEGSSILKNARFFDRVNNYDLYWDFVLIEFTMASIDMTDETSNPELRAYINTAMDNNKLTLAICSITADGTLSREFRHFSLTDD